MQTRRSENRNLVNLTNEELARVERRTTRRTRHQHPPAMGDDNGVNNNAAMAARLERMEQLFRDLQPQQGPTLGGDNLPHTFYTNRSAIILPPIERLDFEVKPQLVTLVEQRQFYGKAHENPFDHIERFEKICKINRYQGVTPEYLQCLLFEYTLSDKAAGWLSSLPPQSLNGWIPARDAFIDYFYTKTKTAQLKSRIANFQQNSGESFSEVWERFKTYIRECPHHGYTDVQQLCIFYDGVNWDIKNQLNAASNGNFMKRTVVKAKELIENLAESTLAKSAEYDRSRKVNSVETHKVDDIALQVAQILQSKQKEVHSAEVENDGQQSLEEGLNEEVNYVNGRGFNQAYNPSFRNHPNLSYRSNNVANPQDQVYPSNTNFGTNQASRPFAGSSQGFQKPPFNNFQPQTQQPKQSATSTIDELKGMMQQLLNNHNKLESDLNGRLEWIKKDINGKFDALSNHVKKLDAQVTQTEEVLKRREAEIKARAALNAIVSGDDDSEDESEDEEPKGDSEELVSVDQRETMVVETGDIIVQTQEGVSQGDEEKNVKQLEAPKSDFVEQALEDEKQNPQNFRVLKKKPDPGRFYIDCSVNGVKLLDSLCDTGANVNVMSQAVAHRLGIRDFKRSKVSLEIPNAVEMTPVGFLPNVMIQIRGCLVPTDFHVLKIDDDPHRPIILGSPFLASVGALTDFSRNRMIFMKIDRLHYYPLGGTGRIHTVSMMTQKKAKRTPPISKEEAKKNVRRKLLYETKAQTNNVEAVSTNSMGPTQTPVEGSPEKGSPGEPKKRRKMIEQQGEKVGKEVPTFVLSS